MALEKQIALERIKILFEEAQKALEKGKNGYAGKYVGLALKISQKYRVALPKELKGKYCKKCHCFLELGKNSAKRIHKDYCEIICRECGAKTKKSY